MLKKLTKHFLKSGVSKEDIKRIGVFDEDKNFNLLDLLKLFYLYKKLIIVIFILVSVFTSIAALSLSNRYDATATFISIKKTDNSLGGLSGLTGIASMVGLSIPEDIGSAVDFEVVMHSRTFLEKIIKKNSLLPEIFKDDYDPVQQRMKTNLFSLKTIKSLISNKEPLAQEVLYQFILNNAVDVIRDDHLKVFNDKQTGLYSVTVSLEDPQKAMEVANTIIQELEAYILEVSSTNIRKSRVFIESQLESTEKNMSKAEEDLKVFSEKYGIFQLTDQATLLSTTMGNIMGEVAIEEVGLKVIEQTYGKTSFQADMSRAKVKALKAQIEKLKSDPENTKVKKSMQEPEFITMEKLPGLGVEYGRLKREVLVQQEIYKMLRTQLESTRIKESEQSENIQVIDSAVLPELPSRPNRKLIILIMGALSIVGTLLYIIVREYVRAYTTIVKSNEET